MLLLAVPIMVACGGNNDPNKAATTGGAPSQTTALKYAQCMRQNGINLPDPNAQGGFSGTSSGGAGGPGALDPNSPKFQTADKTCRKQAGISDAQSNQAGTPPIVQAAMKYAQCMRQHGVTNYPDPVVNNGTVQLGPGPGSTIDQTSPSYQSAATACKSLQPQGAGGP